jgi:hypothetical protein
MRKHQSALTRTYMPPGSTISIKPMARVIAGISSLREPCQQRFRSQIAPTTDEERQLPMVTEKPDAPERGREFNMNECLPKLSECKLPSLCRSA